MKPVLHKSSIPDQNVFIAKDLCEKHFDPTWHNHSEYQLFYVMEGSGTRFIGDNIKAFGKGELVFTGPNLPHLWRSEEKYFDKTTDASSRGIVIYFKENFLGDALISKEEFALVKKLFAKSNRGLEFFGPKKEQVVALMMDLLQLHALEGVIKFLQILNLLSATKEYHYISPLMYDNPLKESETYRMNKVYEYVFNNYRQKVTLDQVADLLHMTPTSFSRYFSMVNNKSFSRFLSEIRIKNACKLLVETDRPIADICYNSGFNTMSNFNSQFKTIMTTTPMEYKKEFLKL